jgi:hypothetical protein
MTLDLALDAAPDAVDLLDAAQARLAAVTADMAALATKLNAHQLVPTVDPRRWEKPGPPVAAGWSSPLKARPSDPSADALWAQWTTGGLGWLAATGGRTRKALARVLSDPDEGARFLDAPGLLAGLMERLRPSAQVALAARVYFSRYPAHPALIGIGAGRSTSGLPRWWAGVGPALPPAEQVARHIAGAIRAGEVRLPAALDLPRFDARGGWERAIADAAPVWTADHAEALLHFLDGGEVTVPSPVGDGVAVALRALVRATERGERVRREVARALSRRVGSPFGGDAAGRWLAVRELLPKVRAWLAGEVLEVVFEHLHPNDSSAGQLKARKEFWKAYTGSVLRIWVAVSSAIKPRVLSNHQVREIRAAMGQDLKVMDLHGRTEQALVWMHLQGSDGQVVTVVEGNANTTLRMRLGAYSPTFHYVDYRQEVTQGPFDTVKDGALCITHQGDWSSTARRYLRDHQIAPS